MKKATILASCLVVGILTAPAPAQQPPNFRTGGAAAAPPVSPVGKDRDNQPDLKWLQHVPIHAGSLSGESAHSPGARAFAGEAAHAGGAGAFAGEASGITRMVTRGGGRRGIGILEAIGGLIAAIVAAIGAAIAYVVNAVAAMFRALLGLFGWKKDNGAVPTSVTVTAQGVIVDSTLPPTPPDA